MEQDRQDFPDRTERGERGPRRRRQERIGDTAPPDGGGGPTGGPTRLMSRTTPSPKPSPPPLTYLPFGARPLRRLPQLLVGLGLYGFSLSVMVRASLGVSPWSVLYEGLERHTSLSFGTISAVLGVLVLLLWIPLKQRPTFGTVANIVVLAYSADLGLLLLPQHLGLPARVGLLAGGVLLNGLSVAVYVGARFGPGPRDGLMTGASAVTGRSLRLVRTLIEVAVLVVGLLLGGSVGAGTVLYALAVGPVTQFFLPWFVCRSAAERGGDRRPAA
ncbi:YitT family protein [Streptomyces sp. NPDC058773]|uniref:membrane protein YczE n=1 Tax=Streptomyces sp. NPDC058773 TaxID=3346632 RepID=UPI0036A03E8E